MLSKSLLVNKAIESGVVGVDIETKDPDLVTLGPGTHRGKGYICGVSIGYLEDDGHFLGDYFPLAHPDTTGEQREESIKLIKAVLNSNATKVGANFAYDYEWLDHEKYRIRGELEDVQYAEPLIDEYRGTYSLDSLALKYLKRQKKSDLLADYCEAMGYKGAPITHIWRIPTKIAAEYAIADVELTLKVLKEQKVVLERQNLTEAYDLERKLIPLLVQMRKVGVRIDVPKFKKVIQKVTDLHFHLKEDLYKWAGYEFNPGSSQQLAAVLDRKGVAYPRREPTPKMIAAGKTVGNPMLDGDTVKFLAKKEKELSILSSFRHYDTMIKLFLKPWADFLVGDRLYSSFHPLRSDNYGTVSGRFSSSKPNLQQVSAKDEEDYSDLELLQGKVLRSLFLPEDDCTWLKSDYSQIEYRIIAHYATGRGADLLRERYNTNPDTDFHQVIVDDTGFDRRTAKRLNFGGAYGLGVPSASKLFGWTVEQAKHFMDSYHRTASYIRPTRNKVIKVATRRGFIFTILNRRARIHSSRKPSSMFNRLIQGSAGDIMKKALVDAYYAGIFDVLIPHLTVHDEVDNSKPNTMEGIEAQRELKVIMEDAVKLDVPIKVDMHEGINWAEAD
jgi:DNA polymerase-1